MQQDQGELGDSGLHNDPSGGGPNVTPGGDREHGRTGTDERDTGGGAGGGSTTGGGLAGGGTGGQGGTQGGGLAGGGGGGSGF